MDLKLILKRRTNFLWVFLSLLFLPSLMLQAQADFDLGECEKSCRAGDLEVINIFIGDENGIPLEDC